MEGCLPSMYEILGSISVIAEEEKAEEEKEARGGAAAGERAE